MDNIIFISINNEETKDYFLRKIASMGFTCEHMYKIKHIVCNEENKYNYMINILDEKFICIDFYTFLSGYPRGFYCNKEHIDKLLCKINNELNSKQESGCQNVIDKDMTLVEFERELESLRDKEECLKKIVTYISNLELNKGYNVNYNSNMITITGDSLKLGLIKEFEDIYESYWSGLEKLRNCGLTIKQINKNDFTFREVKHLMK